MVNLLLSYDRNFQGYIHPVINSTIANTPGAKIFCMVTSDVTYKPEHPQVEYIENDPPEVFGSYRYGRHITGSRAPYNFIHGLALLHGRADRVIINGIDHVNLKDMTPIAEGPVSPNGFAGIEHFFSLYELIKGFAVPPEQIKNKGQGGAYDSYGLKQYYRCLPCARMSTLMVDLDLFKKADAYNEIKYILETWDMAEMAAVNLYLMGRFARIDKKYSVKNTKERGILEVKKEEDLYGIDYAGPAKPWAKGVLYGKFWKQYSYPIGGKKHESDNS